MTVGKALKEGVIDGAAGAGIGATAGLLGGPLAEVTVPAGALIGGAVGTTIGLVHGAFASGDPAPLDTPGSGTVKKGGLTPT